MTYVGTRNRNYIHLIIIQILYNSNVSNNVLWSRADERIGQLITYRNTSLFRQVWIIFNLIINDKTNNKCRYEKYGIYWYIRLCKFQKWNFQMSFVTASPIQYGRAPDSIINDIICDPYEVETCKIYTHFSTTVMHVISFETRLPFFIFVMFLLHLAAIKAMRCQFLIERPRLQFIFVSLPRIICVKFTILKDAQQNRNTI